jgi:hypothetical protein
MTRTSPAATPYSAAVSGGDARRGERRRLRRPAIGSVVGEHDVESERSRPGVLAADHGRDVLKLHGCDP